MMETMRLIHGSAIFDF